MIADLKPYKTYRATQLLWAPDLPAHWAQQRAKLLFKRVDRPVRAEDEVVTCFRDGTVTLRKNRRLRGFTEAIFESGYQGIRKGDLVIHAMDAFAGAIGVSDSDGKGTPVYAVCEPSAGVNPHYYARLVREMSRNQWIVALSRGIRERSTDFRFEVFARQFVPLPPPDEQAAVVRYLDWSCGRLDRAIRAKRKIIASLNEQKRAVTSHAVTRGVDPSVRLKHSGVDWIGEIPANWSVHRIKNLMRTVDHRSSTGAEDLLSVRMHHGIVRFSEHFQRPPQARTLVNFKIVQPGQFVVNRMQAGNGLIYCSDLFGLVSPDYSVLELIADVNKEFLGELMRSLLMRWKFRVESKGLGTGTSGFLRLYDDRLGAVHVALPPRQEQDSIMVELKERLSSLVDATDRVEREMDLLLEYRTRLIADVVTGKLDVRLAAAALPQVEPSELADQEPDVSSLEDEEELALAGDSEE